MDFLLLTAPTDVVGAYRQDPAAFKSKAGDVISMGFYKEVGKDGAKKLMAPYNTMADAYSVRSFWEMLQGGVFKKHYHVPSDTVQLRSGLPGGYFPEGEAGEKLGNFLSALEENDDVEKVSTAAVL